MLTYNTFAILYSLAQPCDSIVVEMIKQVMGTHWKTHEMKINMDTNWKDGWEKLCNPRKRCSTANVLLGRTYLISILEYEMRELDRLRVCKAMLWKTNRFKLILPKMRIRIVISREPLSM